MVNVVTIKTIRKLFNNQTSECPHIAETIKIAHRHGFSLVNLLGFFTIPFTKNTSEGLLLSFQCYEG